MSNSAHPPSAHIVLLEPEIPWNTGNIGRSCLAFDAQLHLIKPLGFSLDEKSVRRAGLDYWQHVAPKVWDSWTHFHDHMLSETQAPWLITPEGELPPWDISLGPSPILIFGSETRGILPLVRKQYAHRRVKIPMASGPIRSINVSTTVGMMLYEVTRSKGSK